MIGKWATWYHTTVGAPMEKHNMVLLLPNCQRAAAKATCVSSGLTMVGDRDSSQINHRRNCAHRLRQSPSANRENDDSNPPGKKRCFKADQKPIQGAHFGDGKEVAAMVG